MKTALLIVLSILALLELTSCAFVQRIEKVCEINLRSGSVACTCRDLDTGLFVVCSTDRK